MAHAKPYCRCWPKSLRRRRQMDLDLFERIRKECSCGEEDNIIEWKWVNPTESSQAILSDNAHEVTFNPPYWVYTRRKLVYVKGDTPMKLNYHYYWEVKMMPLAGYNVFNVPEMVGVGTDQFDEKKDRFGFTPSLGYDSDSYGLDLMGSVRHNSKVIPSDPYNMLGFCIGSIIGIRLDMWLGTLEFYINRKPQGISFCDLRRHTALYPIVCSSSLQSSIKIVHAASWKASLMVDALRILSASLRDREEGRLPPGLEHTLKSRFWLVAREDKPDQRLTRSRAKRIMELTDYLPTKYIKCSYYN